MELALFHPAVGYYRSHRTRVGYGRGSDFFTATSSGRVFGELVAAACARLLSDAGRMPEAHEFVEIGAEPQTGGVLADATHRFRNARVIGIGQPIALQGDCIVFSNELFDAQPFIRTVYRAGRWREIGVQLQGDRFREVELPTAIEGPPSVEGYWFDRSLAAAQLAGAIAAQPWNGLFVAFDYGKTLQELTEETPAGTARAYFRHTQTNDLLARAGDQDLTCHICWDWLEDALRSAGFGSLALEFQEVFFIRHASDYIAKTSAAEASRLSQPKLALLQLLHPAHMGQKFQVLHALR